MFKMTDEPILASVLVQISVVTVVSVKAKITFLYYFLLFVLSCLSVDVSVE